MGGGHHGGGWKIAYADFMTAMMAFFLVMWLLSMPTPKQRDGIAEHFRMPLKVALHGGEQEQPQQQHDPGRRRRRAWRREGEVKQGRAPSEDELDAAAAGRA